ncbi:MAG TPA: response regulator transcription factor [Solirubrobacteraceae bacterium]|nr:response regulator transcription factor [Solirubrobacteraceae bacterium]
MRILVVEDEVKLASLIRRGLREDGLLADVAIRGEDALWMAVSTEYDVIVLDVMLPGIDGMETCRRLRAEGVQAPILMLTARGEVRDRVAGLNVGADDYLAKPFAFAELVARLHALARRGPIQHLPVLQTGDLRLDLVAHRAWRGAHELDLSAREFLLLATLMRHPGAALTRQQLLDHAWEGERELQSNVVDVYIGYLRDKIDRPFGRSSIETVRGVGYRLVEDEASERSRGSGTKIHTSAPPDSRLTA